MKNDLQYDLCEGCGEPNIFNGILDAINHQCPINTVVYRWRKFTARSFIGWLHDLPNPIKQMKADLLQFQYFKAMPDFDTATDLDKKIYRICRESDVRTMKRLRAYIELEDEFDAKY